jgi:carbon storage regulator
MLVLSRRTNEKIVIPDLNITITVVAVKRGVVRIGIDAPSRIPVLREEVLNRQPTPAPDQCRFALST